MRNLIFSEVLAPLLLAAVAVVPYLYINAQTGVVRDNNTENDDLTQWSDDPRSDDLPDRGGVPVATNSILRLAIVALAPIAINAGVLLVFFAMACCMGPVLSMCCKKFGAVLAAIAHGIAVIALIVFFEVMYALEGWNFARTLIGMISAIAIQRFIYKLIIALALTREFKADSANIAWWNGKWYGLGWHSMSQPAREFLCKITELGMFAADFILGHFLLFFMLPLLFIPYIDKIHSTMLFWLRPSRQIRPPIYSLKQTRLRKRRVIRYALLYFTLLIVFLGLIIAPTLAGKLAAESIKEALSNTDLTNALVQPVGLNNTYAQWGIITGTWPYGNAANQTGRATGRSSARTTSSVRGD